MEATEATEGTEATERAGRPFYEGGAGRAANVPGGAGRAANMPGGAGRAANMPGGAEDAEHWAFQPKERTRRYVAGAGGDPNHPDWDANRRPGAWTFRKCRRCGKEFHYMGHNRQFCGDECARKWHGERSNELKAAKRAAKRGATRACARCGKEFQPRNSRARYCCHSCACKAAAHLPLAFEPVVCAWCGRSFTPTRRTQKFCCKPCYDRAFQKRRKRRPAAPKGRERIQYHYPVGEAEEKVRKYLVLPAEERYRRRGELSLGERLLAQQIWDRDHADRVTEVN